MADCRQGLLVLGLVLLCVRIEVLCVQTSGISKYEIVIPERRQLKEKRHAELRAEATQHVWEDNLSYSIKAAGHTYLLMLNKNRGLLSDQFTQTKYTIDGQLKTSPRKEETHCYYHGHVSGVEDSMVALSTCEGLRGILYIDEVSYGIEPKANSSNGEHLLYQLADVQREPSVCGVMSTNAGWEPEDRRTDNSIFQDVNVSYSSISWPHFYRRKRAVLPVTSFVELSVIVDNNRYTLKGSNETAVKMDVFELVNIVGGMYLPLNIQIVLIELNIWTDANPFTVDSGTAGDVLGRFSNWRGTVKGLKRSDASHLLVGRGAYGSAIGMAYVGTVCSPTLASSLSAFSASATPISQAPVVAHELGHNLGMAHDDGRCPSTFIMNSVDNGAKDFSSCSSDDFETLITSKKGTCLKNAPNPQDVLTEPICGNNIVDQGEQCDCGRVQDCKNPCCNAATCTLSSGSQCAQGLCCENCKFKSSGTECRSKSDSCDLPEYCNGTNGLCPADFYMMNGYPCNNSESYCYEGRCQTYDAQCQAMLGTEQCKHYQLNQCEAGSNTQDINVYWCPLNYSVLILCQGPQTIKEMFWQDLTDSRKAIDGCFQVGNLKGDAFGNCGMSGGSYKICAIRDSLCGKLMCSGGISTLPNVRTTIFSYQSHICTSVDFNLGSDVPDPGMVHQGTACDVGKACVDNACVNSSRLGFSFDDKTTCNGHGVGNNEGYCHCNYGWAPPSCNSGGCGGSMVSGPGPCDNRLRDGLLIFFLLVVPILCLLAFLMYIKRNAIKAKLFKRGARHRSNHPKPAESNQAKVTRNQQRNYKPQESNVNVTDVFTISKFPTPRPPASPHAPDRPPPPARPNINTRPQLPPRPLGFHNV